MKIKKLKVSTGTFVAILLILGYREYKEYKLKHESKQGIIIEQALEEIEENTYILPVESTLNDAEMLKPEVKMGK